MSNENPKAISVVFPDVESLKKHFLPRVKGGGILVETESLFPMGSEVLLMIRLPGEESIHPVPGTVVWIMPKDNRDGSPASMGIRFSKDRDGLLNRIQVLLNRLPKDQPQEILAF